MKRRGLFGLVGAGVAAPALASVTPARPFTLDEKMAQAEIKVDEYIKQRFGELVETGRKGMTSEYKQRYAEFNKLWKANDEEAPAKLAVMLVEWIERDLLGSLKQEAKSNQTLIWRDPPSFSIYENLKNEPDILKLRARGHVFVPGKASDMAHHWSFESKLWAERHPGKIDLASKRYFA